MPDITYRDQVDQNRLESIRLMLRSLPRSCADFIRSLGSTTSTLTRLAYTIDLGTFFDFAMKELTCFTSQNATDMTDEEISRLKPRDIEIYADYLSLYFKESSVHTGEQRMLKNKTYGVMRKLSSLRSYFNYLFRTQRIPANIVSLVPLPKKHEKPILLLEHDEMQKLLNAIYSGAQLTPQQTAFHRHTQIRDFAIVMLFLGTGIRVSECVGIDLEDIDFRNNALLVTRKGGNQVILYFPKEVGTALQAYLEQRETIVTEEGHEHAFFLSLQKRRITQRAVELMVKKYAMLVVPLKKRMSPHKLRSTYATNLYQETEDIYLVAEALGHSDVNTTRKHYASMSDSRMRDAAKNTHLRVENTSDSALKDDPANTLADITSDDRRLAVATTTDEKPPETSAANFDAPIDPQNPTPEIVNCGDVSNVITGEVTLLQLEYSDEGKDHPNTTETGRNRRAGRH